MEKTLLQSKLDVQKWLESESMHHDLCGSYTYCAYCVPDDEFPCATAYLQYEEIRIQNETPAAAHVAPVKVATAAKPKTTAKATASKTAAKPGAKTVSPKSATAKTTAPKTTAGKTSAAKPAAKTTAKPKSAAKK